MGEGRKPPTPAQIDALIAEYARAQETTLAMEAAADVAHDASNALKAKLTEMVETYGRRHTEKSKRLEGIHNKATTTTAVVTTTDPVAVETLRGFLEKKDLVELEGRLFVKQITYTLVASPDKVLAETSVATRIRTKLTAMVKSCFKITTRSPSLKVELAEVKKAA